MRVDSQRGWREIGERRIFFRSKWEANYARYLEWLREKHQILAWEYEPRTFWFDHIKRGSRSYTPDFRVVFPDREEWHEVKGWMDPKSKTKLARFGRCYPKEKLVLVERETMKALAAQVGRMCGWE